MTHPRLTRRRADAVADRLRGAVPPLVEIDEQEFATEHLAGSYDREAVEAASEQAKATWDALGRPSKARQLEALEARMAAEVHTALRDLPVATLGDPGFWRYLALFPYRWYLAAREPELQPQDYGGTRPDKENPKLRRSTAMRNQLLFRTFLWGKAAYDCTDPSDPYRRATVVRANNGPEIDIWHSHVVRTQLGQLGRTTHHFIDVLVDEPDLLSSKDPPRAVAKRLTRMKHNVLLDVYPGEDGKKLVEEQGAHVLRDD